MPQSVYPHRTRLDDTPAVLVKDEETEFGLERLHEVAERLNKQLEQVTGLEIEEGDL